MHDATITLNMDARRFSNVNPSDVLAAYAEKHALPHLPMCIDAVDAVVEYREGVSRTERVCMDEHMSIAAHTARSGALGEMHTGKLLLAVDGAFLPLDWPAQQIAFTTHDRRYSGTIGLYAVPDSRSSKTRLYAKHFARNKHAVRLLDTRRMPTFVAHAPAIVLTDSPSHATVRKHCLSAHNRALRDHGLSGSIGTRNVKVRGSLLCVESSVQEDVQFISVFAKTY